jgi:hypothetical protein
MALTADQLATLAALAGQAPSARAAAASIRTALPGLRASVVDAFDLRDEQPALQAGGLSVYLMSCDGHCWSVTGDPAQASAVVVAERS